MGQEYFINSQVLQDKVANLLPSQGGAGAGFDLSASTQIIPIIDVTESAEGSDVRQDLQTALSFGTATRFKVLNNTNTIISNTGYWRIVGSCTLNGNAGGTEENEIIINDGTTDNIVWSADSGNIGTVLQTSLSIDLVVFLEAGHTLKMKTTNLTNILSGSVRQIADINGTLVNP